MAIGLQQNYARNETVTVGTSEVIISTKRQRKTYYIRNSSTGAQVVTIVLDNFVVATAGRGIILSPGEFILDSKSYGYDCWNGDIKAIANAAGATVTIMEQPEVQN